MGDVDGQPHVGEVESVTQPDQRESDDVMSHQLLEILPRFLQQQGKNDELLCPVASLQQVVRFEQPFVCSVREPFKHPRGIEVPHWSPAHDEQTKRTEDAEVHGRVHLFHEPILFRSRLDPICERHGPDEPLHEEFAGEGEDDDVKSHEDEVVGALAVVSGRVDKAEIEMPLQRVRAVMAVVGYVRVVGG